MQPRPAFYSPTLVRYVVAIAACLVVPLAGCSTFLHKSIPDYRTVEANPNRDTARAEELHGKAVKVLKHCETCYNCECVARVLCNPCKAERHLQDALIADVRYGPAHNTLGTLYLSQHKLYLAAWEFEYAASLMPGRPEPFNNLGLVYEEAGRLGEAIESYEQAYAITPTNAEYIGNLARAMLRQGTPIDEVRYLLSELRMHDSRPDWLAWADDMMETHADGPSATTPTLGGSSTEPLTQPTLIEPEALPSPSDSPLDNPALKDSIPAGPL